MARRRGFRFLLILLTLAALLVLSYRWWLPWIGWALVHDDGPRKADVAVVLGGDYWGHRIEYAANLVKQGYIPKVLVSGPPGFYGFHESDMAISFITQKGYPREWFEAAPLNALSTKDEAPAMLKKLQELGVHRALIVTSTFHTARARRIFLKTERAMGGDIDLRMVAAPDQFFRPELWWSGRESQKITVTEWTKTIATALGY